MASIRDILAGLFAKESPSAIQGTPLGNAYPSLAQPEAPLEAPFLSPDDLIGTGIGKAALAGGAKLAPMLLGQTAYHGSAKLFNPLNILPSAKGTYGAGVYLAEKPFTAEKYGKELYKYDIPDDIKLLDVYKQKPEDYKNLYQQANIPFNPKVEEYLKLGAHTNAFQEAQKDIGNLDKFGFKGIKGYSEFGGNEYSIFDPSILKSLTK
jgi:hypothetical protein